MELGLRERVALVAASSRGLGRAVADALAAEGVHLVMCARGEAQLLAAKEEIESEFGASVVALTADLTRPEDVERVVSAGLEAFGQIDILVTNTGGPPAGPFQQHAPEDWSAAVHQNLDSVLNLTRAVLPRMKKQRWGRIINVTSIAVKQPVDNLILSNSVRAAVTGFAKTLASEVASYGVTVNNVMPGYTKTERVESLAEQMAVKKKATPEEIIAAWEAEIPMGRLGTPPEFAALVAFLASERASYITGTSIPVDGGWIKSLV